MITNLHEAQMEHISLKPFAVHEYFMHNPKPRILYAILIWMFLYRARKHN
jgi:hypothetical protein